MTTDFDITFDRSSLRKTLSRIKPLTTAFPMVRLTRADGPTVRVEATDAVTFVSLLGPRTYGEATMPGAAVVRATALRGIAVASRAEGAMTVRGDGTVEVRDGLSRSHDRAIQPHQYPTGPKLPSYAPTARIGAAKLGRAIGAVQHASSTNAVQPHLHGVRLTVRDGRLECVATDGHRMARCRQDGAEGASLEVTLPAALATLVVDLCARTVGQDTVTIRVSADAVEIATSDERASAWLFPCTRFYPSADVLFDTAREHRTTALLHARKLHVLLERAVTRDARGVALSVRPDAVDVSGEATGASGITADAETDGPALAIGVNADYLSDALEAVDAVKTSQGATDPRVSIRFGCELDPIVVDASGSGYSEIVMPMRI